jgi:microsomal dipeptidase-like Zn-dependent dipeptidase
VPSPVRALAAGGALTAGLGLWLNAAGLVDARMNHTLRPGPYKVSEPAAAVHRRLFVADLHADSLLFGRDLLQRSALGHVDLENVDVLYDAGFRMMSPVHFFDNEVGGSAHGVRKGGLTVLGREVIRRMEQRGMIVDLAHASPRTIEDALALATRPVVVSHTGVRGTCDNTRNLSDGQLRAIARGGGVVGIGYWDTAVCGTDVHAIARAIRHAVVVAGIDHVALGSDFDGAVTVPFDASGLPLLTESLLEAGFSEEEASKVMGGNVLRLLAGALHGYPRASETASLLNK